VRFALGSGSAVIGSDLNQARKLEERLLEEVPRCGFSDAEVFAVKLALEECFINAIRHGNKFDPKKTVHVNWNIDEQRADFTIRDEGEGFAIDTVPDPTTDENLEKPCGRGLMLIRAYMDEVKFNEHGNQIHMVKRRSK